MDKEKILEDGLLEQHLLGALEPAQRLEVEAVLFSDMALMDQYRRLEANFERIAFENAVEPPEQIRKSLENAMDALDGTRPIIALKEAKTGGNQFRMRWLVAAGMATFFAISSLWLYNKWESSEENLQVLQQQTTDLQNRLVDLEKEFSDTNRKFRAINNPNVVPIVLAGNKKLPNSRAVVYINHRSKEVFLNPQGLPALDKDHTYQMWADVKGVMIDMGIVPTDKELVDLAYIDKAESLNITIEPAGGNDHPTVENLVSNVYL